MVAADKSRTVWQESFDVGWKHTYVVPVGSLYERFALGSKNNQACHFFSCFLFYFIQLSWVVQGGEGGNKWVTACSGRATDFE